jgi:hypothetical protein
MELALQVVGLKMTGKLEDAKSIAMRILASGPANEDIPSGSNTPSAMQLSTDSLSHIYESDRARSVFLSKIRFTRLLISSGQQDGISTSSRGPQDDG